MSLAPIVLFAYNRPWHVKQTLESLSKNAEAIDSDLFIYVDGPKPNATAEQLQKNKDVKAVIREKEWCKSVTIFESDSNKGLADSVIQGITKIFTTYERVIVIEDDVLVSPFFLRFMNDALTVFEKENRLLSIGSWNYFTNPNTTKENFFMNMPDTIAWATWKRSWNLFEYDGLKLYNQLHSRGLMKKFNLDGKFDFESMLLSQTQGKVSSWAIRWTAIAVLNNTLSLYPKQSLSKHIGFGTDSTNCEGDDYNKNLVLAHQPIEVKSIALNESLQARKDWLFIEKEIKHSGAIMDSKFFAKKILRFTYQLKNKLLNKK
jgi:hypothetical protein